MKRRIILLILTAVCILTCGCKQETADFEVLPNAAFGTIHEEPPETKFEEAKPHEPVIKEIVDEENPFFEDLDFSEALFESDQEYVDYATPPRNYFDLMFELKYHDGIIVSGYAHDLRKRYDSSERSPKTATSFRVEQVYCGTLAQKDITIIEPYYPVMKDGQLCIRCFGYEYSMLKNNQKVLMFLRPTAQKGVYFPIYYELPLPEDYQDYDENAQKELLDFYRGKKEAYPEELRYNTERVEKEIIEFPDGTVQEQYHFIGSAGPTWPERDISDEALLKEMDGHILLRLATQYKIKIWPKDHLRFSSIQDRPSDEGIRILSKPQQTYVNHNPEQIPSSFSYESREVRTNEHYDETVVRFKDQDFSDVPSVQLLESEHRAPFATYSELMEWLSAKNGLIVTGYAQGIREGHWSTLNMAPYTRTEFSIEKVYYGELKEDTVIVHENYCPVSENDHEYIEFDGPCLTHLKDGQKVLLALIPTKTAGVYAPCYFELPLPEDYQTFDATAEQELLNYYQGDSVPKTPSEKEAFAKKMEEHILVRLALDYRIKIWPQNHIRFSVTTSGFAIGGLEALS